MARKKATRRKKVEPRSRGLAPADLAGEKPPAAIQALAEKVGSDGGAPLAVYREPLSGNWQLFVALPIEKVAPTPFQRDLSDAHLKRLTQRIEELGRFLDPIIAVRRDDGTYWTPNGNHRLHALQALGARTVVALLAPEEKLAYQILALNTEKAHNLREKALEVIRMARDLAQFDDGSERDHESVFEDPVFLTLGACYEKNGRFAGSVYQSVLRRVEAFQALKLSKALALREARAALLIELDEAVSGAVARLKERGFDSPYLKSFVVARINPIRFAKTVDSELEEVVGKMLAAARKFDVSKVKADQIARSGGPPEAGD